MAIEPRISWGAMSDPQPAPWLDDARADIGKYHDGRDVPMLAQQVAKAFPNLSAYCALAGPTTAWCGIYVAAKLARYGIRPPYTPGNDLGSFMWADSWADTGWGTSIPIGQEQPGDVAIFKSPHHVTFVAGDGKYVGGNQSDGVTEAPYAKGGLRAVRRPPVAQTQPVRIDKASTQFDACVALVLVSEGGNDDDPRDPGGRTSRGILQREWDKWRQSHPGLPADVWDAPQDQVVAIYRQQYWDALCCDDLPAGVDYAVFDYGVNSGIGRSAKVLQRLVGTEVDGEVGPLTIAATAQAEPRALVGRICDERMAFLRGLKTWPTFGKGWTNRVNRVRADALAMVGRVQPEPEPEPEPIPEPSSDPVIAQILARLDALERRLEMMGWPPPPIEPPPKDDDRMDIGLLLKFLPLIVRIAPEIRNAIAAGIPIIDAIRKSAPTLLPILQRLGAEMAQEFGGSPDERIEDIASRTFISPSERHDNYWIQRALNVLGAKPALEVDGEYGLLTIATVKLFQEAFGLEVDGIAGDGETIPAIEAELKARRLVVADGAEA